MKSGLIQLAGIEEPILKSTVKLLKIWTPEKIAVIILKLEQFHFIL